MKKMVFLFLIVFLSNAFAIGFETNKSVFEKQELIRVSGDCDQTQSTTLKAVSDELEIFSSSVECRDDSFEFEYQTSLLDHSGEWELTLFSQKESVSKTIFVKEKREGGFFLIRFLSPASGQYQKNQLLVISVEVTDAGSYVTDAQVVTWGTKGEKLEFQNNGNGLYVLEYVIPLDAPIGEWNLEVLAQAKKGEEFFGGIGELKLQVESAPIVIEVVEPKVSSFEQGEQINFDVIVKYVNGNPMEEGEVFIVVGQSRQNLEQVTLENFKGTYLFPSDIIGAVEIELKAVDSSENQGSKTLKVVVGCSVTCLIKQYGLFVAAIVLVALALGKLFYSHLSFKSRIEKLQKEKQKINNLIKDLQKEYFTKGVMPSQSYRKNISEYKSRLVQIEQEIMELKKKEEAE